MIEQVEWNVSSCRLIQYSHGKVAYEINRPEKDETASS
jgi:hypothetical protein